MKLFNPSAASAAAASRTTLISVVVPCYNEAIVLPETHGDLSRVLSRLENFDYEIVYVDDGSRDATPEIIRELQATDKRVRAVLLSRNFGHQIAVSAGLKHAAGNGIVVIDADLQDPPEVIPEMILRWQDGYHVVYGMRAAREAETPFKVWTAKAFYRVINRLSKVRIPLDVGDFRFMDRAVVDVLLAMPERDRFLRGMVSWVGFRQVSVMYRRAPRRAGRTKYSLLKMLQFAVDGIVSFSVAPLRIATWVGFLVIGAAFAGILYALAVRLYTDDWVRGWASVFIAVLFLGGVQLVTLGIVGEYVGRIYAEVKRRPLYVVQEELGFENVAAADAAKNRKPSEARSIIAEAQQNTERSKTKIEIDSQEIGD